MRTIGTEEAEKVKKKKKDWRTITKEAYESCAANCGVLW